MPVLSKMDREPQKSYRRTPRATGAAACVSAGMSVFSFMTSQTYVHWVRGRENVVGIPATIHNDSMQYRPFAVFESRSLHASCTLGKIRAIMAGLVVANAFCSGKIARATSKQCRCRIRAHAEESNRPVKSAITSTIGFHESRELVNSAIEDSGHVHSSTINRIQEIAAAQLCCGQNWDKVDLQAFSQAVSCAGSMVSYPLAQRVQQAVSSSALMLICFVTSMQPATAADQVAYSDFLEEVQKDNVQKVQVYKRSLTAQYSSKDGAQHTFNLVPNVMVDDQLFETLANKKIDVVMENARRDQSLMGFLSNWAGSIAWLIVNLLLLFGGPGINPFEFGKSKARVIMDGDTNTKFVDVAGCDGAKTELEEVVDFLKHSNRYSSLGAKIPKGALLVGPPGTGKTLLAKAVAGEAGVPFFSTSASEFVEMYVGVGAARVRDLFTEAKKSAPCIIFIDEIDAVGRQRGSSSGRGNDEREQTINQLLTEMDGFEANSGVVVIAATNRADILDKALVRPGRFDRHIQVDPPDVEGRVAILKVHARDKSLAPSVDLTSIARQTPGMSGADLANLLNEGAIVAARHRKLEIDSDDISNALERITIGLEKKDVVMSEQKKKLVAYHEAGHAILGALMNDYDAVAKISIVPRGPAGGVTIFMPSEERLNTGLYTKEFLQNQMCVALGGRIAEELINGIDNVTTGASNDFQRCTQVAQTMVMQLGMSDLVGQRALTLQQSTGSFTHQNSVGQAAPQISQKLKSLIDTEVRRIIDEQYTRGKKLLKENMCLMDRLAKMLIEQEKVSGEQLRKLMDQVTAEGKLVAAA